MGKRSFSLVLRTKQKFAGSGLSRLPGMRSLNKFLYRMSDPGGIILIDVQDSKMYVNTQDKAIVPHLITKGVWEPYLTKLFHSLIKPGDIVVDIGANIGYYTMIAAKMTGEEGRVYSFEPEPGNYDLLTKNVKINNYSNVVSINKALSYEKGKMVLHLDKTNLGSHSFIDIEDPRRKAGSVSVDTITLDQFFMENGSEDRIDLIKMDTEGAEGLVVSGARELLQKRDPKILMEFWPAALRKLGNDPLNLLRELQGYGYEIKFLDDEKQQMRKMPFENIIEYCDVTLGGTQEVSLYLEK